MALLLAAVDTFLKIAQKCRRKFVQVQPTESQTFIEELCTSLPGVIADLEAHQVHTFYEAAGCMVAAHNEPAMREYLTGEQCTFGVLSVRFVFMLFCTTRT